MRKIETYWYFWGVLVASLIFAVILGIQADWSHAMKKRISLGFAKEVTSPVIALELAGNSDDFQHVLGISLPTDGAARRNDLPVEPEASLSDIERDVQSFDAIFLCDYAFLVLYAILLLLLISHLRTSGAIRSKSAGGLLAALVIVAAIADAVENTVARGPISKALDVLSKIYSEVQELAAQERVEQTRRLEQDGKAAAPQLEASGVKAPDLKADWAALNNRKIVTFSTTSKGVDTMVREAIREKVNAPTVDQIRLSANPKEALRALDEAGYLVLSGKEVQPGPESEVKSAAENPREYTLQELRRVCQVPGQALRISSLIKWGVASVLSVVLGWLMLRSNYSLPDSHAAMSLREGFHKYIIESPSAPAGVDRCLGGLLLIIGGGTCLAGVFIWPICIESGFLFIMAAFLPLLIGGLHQIVNRPQASVVTQAEESAEGLAYG